LIWITLTTAIPERDCSNWSFREATWLCFEDKICLLEFAYWLVKVFVPRCPCRLGSTRCRLASYVYIYFTPYLSRCWTQLPRRENQLCKLIVSQPVSSTSSKLMACFSKPTQKQSGFQMPRELIVRVHSLLFFGQ